MKTSVIEVRDMLSVLSVLGVEKRIGDVPGVESVTVNYAAGSATVRYDESRLVVADIKSAVRQRAYEPKAPAAASAADSHLDQLTSNAPPESPAPTPPSPAPDATGAVPAAAAPAGDGKKDKAPPDVPPSAPLAAEPKASSGAPEAAPGGKSHEGHQGHAAPGAQPAMSDDMAHEMGHGGKDMGAMVRDMRNRFWICLIFTVPIFVYAPMGGMWQAPAPPFGLDLNLWLFFFASAAILYPSWPFFVAAWRGLLKGTLV